ncbi:putative permease [Clavibacter michiganensis subsp. michiganensis]|uniref:Putative permease n=1 Tax=Clavibacter michiganensis subsp. michiganensis TaxID=33013 RepID=A0A251XJD4_CLAMM|nr:putative permease [Clavibacter michiganensis subsp. michiganensis]OUE03624.1 putative permease [Clavibacter michiganensis subsp. michiganensis]
MTDRHTPWAPDDDDAYPFDRPARPRRERAPRARRSREGRAADGSPASSTAATAAATATATRARADHDHPHDHDAPRPARATPAGIRTGLATGLALVLLLLALRAASPALGDSVLPDRLQDLVTLSVSVIVESLPFVILGIVLSIVVQVWVPPGVIERRLPRNPFARRACISFLGMALPVCECGNVPLARGLVVRGFTVPESITFLLAAPILNPITIITTHAAFGWDGWILVARLVGGFLIANVVGWLFSLHPEPDRLLTDEFRAECALPDPHAHGGARVRKSISLFGREATTIMPALVIGSLLAGLIQVAVPREVLVTLGGSPILSVLALMLLAFVVSVCSNVDAFFVLSFGSVFLPGGIVAFLVFGRSST